MDYSIEQDGQHYHDPSIPLDQITWQYTVVPIDYNFPNIKCEILDSLYLTGDDESELEEKSFELLGYENNSNILTEKAASFTPQGKIVVYNTTTRKPEPLKNIKIRIRNWFKISNVKTNSNGQFKSTKSYRKNVDIKIIFNNNHFDMRSTLFDILNTSSYKIANELKENCDFLIQKYNGKLPYGYYDYKLVDDTRLWAEATISNAVEDYFIYCVSENVPTPAFLDIWANQISSSKEPSSAAPMFSYGYKFYNISWDKWWSYAANILYIPVSNVLMHMFQGYLPDIIIGFNKYNINDSNKLSEIVFHELAHASHFKKVGSGYWDNIINDEISHKNYGNGTSKNAGMVAITEAWAYHFSWYLGYKKYSGNAYSVSSSVEKFVPLKIPSDSALFTNEYYRPSGAFDHVEYTGWIPAGLLYDLIDKNIDKISTQDGVNFYDNANGFTNKNIYNALDKDIRSPIQFKNRLLLETSNRDKADVNNLFKAYYY